MSMENIFPLVLLFGVIGLVLYLTTRRVNIGRKYRYGKRVQWMLVSYIVILIISVGLSFFIPKPESVFSDRLIQKNIPDLDDLAYEEKPIDISSVYIKDQWEFEYQQDQLHIKIENINSDNPSEIPLLVDRGGESDNMIEVIYYETPTIVEGVDVSDQIGSIGIDLSSQNLKVNIPEAVEIQLTAYKSEFPVTQFTGKTWWMMDAFNEDLNIGTQLLYLRVPKNIKINAEEHLDINYMSE